MLPRLLRTAFFTALFSYVAFLFLDYLEPGFVSSVFSVHVIGAIALVLGVLFFFVPSTTRPLGHSTTFPLALLLGAGMAYVVMREGAVFGDVRLLLALAVLLLPVCALWALDDHEVVE